jgi:hypothetical protein
MTAERMVYFGEREKARIYLNQKIELHRRIQFFSKGKNTSGIIDVKIHVCNESGKLERTQALACFTWCQYRIAYRRVNAQILIVCKYATLARNDFGTLTKQPLFLFQMQNRMGETYHGCIEWNIQLICARDKDSIQGIYIDDTNCQRGSRRKRRIRRILTLRRKWLLIQQLYLTCATIVKLKYGTMEL